MSMDCDSHNVEDAIASQLVFPITMLRRVRHALPEFAFKSDIMVFLYTTLTQVELCYASALNDTECELEFEEGKQMDGIKKSL